MLRYLLDEQLRGPLWNAIQRQNARGATPLDVVRVGDVDDLPLGIDDSAILAWTERHERVFVSHDKSTLPLHLAQHLATGHHCPGIFTTRSRASVSTILDWLVLAAYASIPDEWRDSIQYIG